MPAPITALLIAPCGINCGVCLGHLREKNRCPGCNSKKANRSAYCRRCTMRNCRKRGRFCFHCKTYPCYRLKQLDKRYRTRYGMSPVENLDNIKELGIRQFVRNEKRRWACRECGSVVCVHRGYCLNCGKEPKG